MRRLLFIICIALLTSCQNTIDKDRAIELASYLGTLESAESRMEEQIVSEKNQFVNEMENMGLTSDPVITKIDENLHSYATYSSFISEWKKVIIENTGGYSMDDNLPEGWYKTIKPKDYLPNSEMDSVQIEGEKSVLIALIELTTLQLQYSAKLYNANNSMIGLKQQPELSELVIANSIQEPNSEIEGPLLYSFDYYPIDSLEINGKWFYGNDFVEISRDEWNSIKKKDLRINLPMKLFWGDTTFQFISKKK